MKRPPFLEFDRDRHGNERCYFRKDKGARIRLRAPIGTDDFNQEYAAALAASSKTNVVRNNVENRTIDSLINSYRRTVAFKQLRATTRKTYEGKLASLATDHGHRLVVQMSRPGIESKILQPLADRPGAALGTLKMLRVLISHAMAIGWIDRDPSRGIKRPKIAEIRSWTDDEIAQFEARWPIGSKQRLAFALMLYLGQRRSDIHRLTWAQYDGAGFTIKQQKTGTTVKVAVHPELQAILKRAPRDHVVIVTTEYSRPFTVDGFSGWFRANIEEAGLPLDCQPHGLRKAAGRRLAEAGASTHEIMAVLGHTSLAQVELYTRQARQATLAESAIAKLEKHAKFSRTKNPRTKS